MGNGSGVIKLHPTVRFSYEIFVFFIVFEANIVCCAVFTSFFSAAATDAAVNKPNKPKEI